MVKWKLIFLSKKTIVATIQIIDYLEMDILN